MSGSLCLGPICFYPLDAGAPKFFGFSEFLVGLALMVVAWTLADIRYRFRVRTAPLPLQQTTFAIVAAVGFLTLLTDLWRAQEWLVPEGKFLTPSIWQAMLGSGFFLTFLTWAWFAFIRPPIYGKLNAVRYALMLYRIVLKGSPSELSIIADEFALSAKSLVHHAPDWRNLNKAALEKLPEVSRYANDVLSLIADKRFCRAVVDASPATALAVFQEVAKTKKYGVRLGTFAKNIVNAALMNKDSFLFHEADGYESGLMGYHKPLSQAMFSNYEMVKTVGTLLDPDINEKGQWDSTQWAAYCRVVLMTLSDYVEKEFLHHSSVLYRAMENIENAVSGLYKLNGSANGAWDDDLHATVQVVAKFINDVVETLDKKAVPDYQPLRIRENQHQLKNIYDYTAQMIVEVIFSASAVRSPIDLCWWIQHNSVWGELFNIGHMDGAAGSVVKFKVRRLLYDDIAEMKRFPNFKGAKILGFCLNVMGLTIGDKRHDRDMGALQRATLSWTKKNYAWLYSYNQHVAEACLVDGMTYDAQNLRLVRTYPAEGLRREPHYVYFSVDAPPPGEATLGIGPA